jgi:hypothetical protein
MFSQQNRKTKEKVPKSAHSSNSSLSSRLLRSYSSASAVSSVQSSKSNAYSSRSSLSSLTGYSADRESVVSDQATSSISSAGKHNRFNQAHKSRTKRTKLLEDNFRAANALQDIEDAKKPFLMPKIGESTNFMGGIDLTKVKHFLSSEYPPLGKESHRTGPDFSTTLTHLNDTFVQVAPFYLLLTAPGSENKCSSRDSDTGSSSGYGSETGSSSNNGLTRLQSPLEVVA